MKNRINLKAERVATTRSTTTTEATTFFNKVEHLEGVVSNKLRQMGVKPIVKKIK